MIGSKVDKVSSLVLSWVTYIESSKSSLSGQDPGGSALQDTGVWPGSGSTDIIHPISLDYKSHIIDILIILLILLLMLKEKFDYRERFNSNSDRIVGIINWHIGPWPSADKI